VDRITSAARADEVHGAPTYIFSGGFRLVGAQDYAVFSSVARRLLARGAQATPASPAPGEG
jgi:predicted DsbA family dithiol-disulfide isomerase